MLVAVCWWCAAVTVTWTTLLLKLSCHLSIQPSQATLSNTYLSAVNVLLCIICTIIIIISTINNSSSVHFFFFFFCEGKLRVFKVPPSAPNIAYWMSMAVVNRAISFLTRSEPTNQCHPITSLIHQLSYQLIISSSMDN